MIITICLIFFIAWSQVSSIFSSVKWNVDKFCNFFWALLWYRYWKYIWRFLPICQLKPLNDTSNTSQGAISSSKLENWLKSLFMIPSSCTTYHGFLSSLPGQKEQLLEEGVILYLITCVKSLQSCRTLCDPMDCTQTGI